MRRSFLQLGLVALATGGPGMNGHLVAFLEALKEVHAKGLQPQVRVRLMRLHHQIQEAVSSERDAGRRYWWQSLLNDDTVAAAASGSEPTLVVLRRVRAAMPDVLALRQFVDEQGTLLPTAAPTLRAFCAKEDRAFAASSCAAREADRPPLTAVLNWIGQQQEARSPSSPPLVSARPLFAAGTSATATPLPV